MFGGFIIVSHNKTKIEENSEFCNYNVKQSKEVSGRRKFVERSTVERCLRYMNYITERYLKETCVF